MAIGWMTVLKMVPWTDVIKNAPAVADGAKKLWRGVGKNTPTASAVPVDEASIGLLPEAQTLVLLQRQVSGLENTVADLHQQMLASSELITVLAEQNAQLIKRVELNRRRLLALAGLTLLLGLVVAVKMALPLLA